MTTIIRPQPGPQETFLASPADIAIAGGAAGVGKTWALLMEPLRHIRNKEFGAVIFRRESPQITNEGGLWDESEKLYPALGAKPRTSPTTEWSFPAGSKVRFAHMQLERDKFSWDGAQIPLIGFDQLEHFLGSQFWYMLSRNRSMCGVRPYIRATCNPVPDDDPIGGWLAKLIAWWIDQDTGYPIWERSGVLRWFVRLNDQIEWADSPGQLIDRFPNVPIDDLQPKSLTFIPGKLEDNQALMTADPSYRASLLALPLVERERLLGGNWKIRASAGKVFNRAWFSIVGASPVEARRVRGWDKAGTEGAGDWSAGVRIAEAHGVYYVEDVTRGQWSSLMRNKTMKDMATSDGIETLIDIEQEPGSAGKESAETSVRDLAGFTVRTKTASGDKVTRAGPFSAQAEAGNVKIVKGAWNDAYLSELHNFPDGEHDDQVDASSVAFNRLSLRRTLEFMGGFDVEQTEDAKAAREKEQHDEGAALIAEAVAAQGYWWPR